MLKLLNQLPIPGERNKKTKVVESNEKQSIGKYYYWLPNDSGMPQKITTSNNSVILIGPNGSGKSRLGIWIEEQNHQLVHRIGAQRNLNFEDELTLKSYDASENSVLYGYDEPYHYDKRKYGLNGREHDNIVTHMFDDFNNALSALIAKYNNANSSFIKKYKEAENRCEEHPKAPKTDLDILFEIWNDLFPNCSLEFEDLRFWARNLNCVHGERYAASKMSDGERTILYFVAQVLCVPNGHVILVDEPELHLHRSLIVKLWSALERYRDDCLFIYITHDTQFADLHPFTDKYWIKSYTGENTWVICRIDENDYPEQLSLDLLGYRKSILFVEGTPGSLDTRLYSIFYKMYEIIPCGSCEQVISRVKAFNNTRIVHDIKAYGIIDRDYRSDYELAKYQKHNIFSIEVAEVENLFITEELIKAVAKHNSLSEEDTFTDIKKYIIEERFKKQINSQICKAVVAEIKYRLSVIDINKQNEETIKTTFESELAKIDFETIKNEMQKHFSNLVDCNDYHQVIRTFNEKGLSRSIGHYFGVIDQEYPELVIRLLNNGAIDIYKTIGKYLPDKDSIPRK